MTETMNLPKMEAVAGNCVRTAMEPGGRGGIMVADLHYPGTPFTGPERASMAAAFAAAPLLLAELEHTKRNLASMLHMLPLNAPEVERRSLQAWHDRTAAALALANGEG